jgi:hypothetical protein
VTTPGSAAMYRPRKCEKIQRKNYRDRARELNVPAVRSEMTRRSNERRRLRATQSGLSSFDDAGRFAWQDLQGGENGCALPASSESYVVASATPRFASQGGGHIDEAQQHAIEGKDARSRRNALIRRTPVLWCDDGSERRPDAGILRCDDRSPELQRLRWRRSLSEQRRRPPWLRCPWMKGCRRGDWPRDVGDCVAAVAGEAAAWRLHARARLVHSCGDGPGSAKLSLTTSLRIGKPRCEEERGRLPVNGRSLARFSQLDTLDNCRNFGGASSDTSCSLLGQPVWSPQTFFSILDVVQAVTFCKATCRSSRKSIRDC